MALDNAVDYYGPYHSDGVVFINIVHNHDSGSRVTLYDSDKYGPLPKLHPLHIISKYCHPLYKQWAMNKYHETGRTYLRNKYQICRIERGRFCCRTMNHFIVGGDRRRRMLTRIGFIEAD